MGRILLLIGMGIGSFLVVFLPGYFFLIPHGPDTAHEVGHDTGASPDAHATQEVHWTYTGATGPDHWGQFFPQCGLGESQSPINIKGPFKAVAAPIKIHYQESRLKLLNNGHTIQVNYDEGSSITIHDEEYALLQFHFHKPSEEQINGQAKAMVTHFVHKSKAGKLAVIGVLLEEGKENELIKTLWANLPQHEGQEEIAHVQINAAKLLPANRAYYHYMGSLTTPPCTEGVAFYIMKNMMEVSKPQVAAFPFEKNARPVQPLHGREIFEGVM